MEGNATKAARFILGAAMLIFGSNKYLGFIPAPEHSPEAGALLGAMAATGYFFPMVIFL